ncbi:hypothetical protein GQ42DRAFT_22430 [Ramicandelaber brevisporus]|nr:hypothetical protein GQ42DRAFT_22430 [Ramicandelaber brevisporus]
MQSRTKRARLDPAVVAPVCQLLRLPRELLEMVAAYFSRRETVPVLTVNSTLHEIFAERIWRRLDTYKRSIPLEPLLKYGHLVRRMRVTKLIPQSIDLAATFPNITHLWLSFFELADAVKSSQGKCFERICFLGIKSFNYKFDKTKPSRTVNSVLNWIDSRFEAEVGLEKVEWELSTPNDMKWLTRLLPWFRPHCAKDRIYFVLSGDGVNLNEITDVDTRALVSKYLIKWYAYSTDKCTTAALSANLDTIPPAERQHFTFPALKQLKIGACCDAGDEVYSQFNFGKLFPCVRDLILDTNRWSCDNDTIEDFGFNLYNHPWPSVRKLEISGDLIYEDSISDLAVLTNVEELSMYRNASDGEYDDWATFNLCDIGRALPKLVRLKVEAFDMESDPQNKQQQQKLFRQLRYIHFKRLTMKASAIDTLVHAPALVDLCLERVDFENEAGDSYGGTSDSDSEFDSDSNYAYNDDDDDYGIKTKKRFPYDPDGPGYERDESAIKLGFLDGAVNAAVRFIDIHVPKDPSPKNHKDIIKAILRCFVNMRVCTIHTEDRKSFQGIPKEFPVAKIKYIK